MEKSVFFVVKVEIIRKCIKHVIGSIKYNCVNVVNIEQVAIAPG